MALPTMLPYTLQDLIRARRQGSKGIISAKNTTDTAAMNRYAAEILIHDSMRDISYPSVEAM